MKFDVSDVTKAGDMQKLAQFTLEKFGQIDVLINNAAFQVLSPLRELKVSE